MAITVSENDNGAVVCQVTESAVPKSNIYCETPWCSADSKNFIFQALHDDGLEYILCEFGTWKMQSIGRGLGAPSINHEGIFHYRRPKNGGAQELVRLDLATGDSRVIYELSPDLLEQTRGWIAVSKDERYIAYGSAVRFDPQLFAIDLLTMADGAIARVAEDPFICNPHTQFDPTYGDKILVQYNRGCSFLPDGTRVLLVGPEGATIFLADVPDGNITRLQLGPPFTPPITGHEAWIHGSYDMLLSVRAVGEYAPEKGNLVRVGPGSPARIISGGYRFNHVGTSPCGRYFFCDDWQGNSKLVIGSIETGKNTVVCEAFTSRGRAQNTHGHPYLSPDLKWLVFNSDRPGVSQIHVASVPESLIQSLN